MGSLIKRMSRDLIRLQKRDMSKERRQRDKYRNRLAAAMDAAVNANPGCEFYVGQSLDDAQAVEHRTKGHTSIASVPMGVRPPDGWEKLTPLDTPVAVGTKVMLSGVTRKGKVYPVLIDPTFTVQQFLKPVPEIEPTGT